MKISKISIDGYGRFAGRTLTFAPGLQVIIGPNEKGKSTIRCFIADMLYGQKRSLNQRLYDEANTLRLPWENPDCYGGSLVYERANGQEIEIIRNFDRKRETVQVYDRSHAREITGDFERLRNREVNFAFDHLGLSKEVFLGVATISHFSLDDLGDKDALNQIREKLLSLADAGNESHSADTVLKLLKKRLTTIGQPTARTKPLPVVRRRLMELEQERACALALQKDIADVAMKRRALLHEMELLRQRRQQLDTQQRLLEAHERARQLEEAENLHARIETATQHCFALGKARTFPLEQNTEVQQAETRFNSATLQLERTQAELDKLTAQFNEEQETSGNSTAQSWEDIPEALEERFTDVLKQRQRIEERIDETSSLVENAKSRLEKSRAALDELPNFSRLSADPVEWFTQLSSSFAMALRSRDEERRTLAQLQAVVDERREVIAESHALFRNVKDFPEQARNYAVAKRVQKEQLEQRQGYLHSLEGTREELADNQGFVWLTALCALVLSGLGAAYFMTEKTAILYAASLIMLACLYFLSNFAYARARVKRLAAKIAELRAELQAMEGEEQRVPGLIEDLLEQADLESIRELEAHYDEYREAHAELSACVDLLRQQEEKARECEERIPKLIERFQETFAQVGETIEGEDDVARAAGNAIARYQAYREAKRHVSDSRMVLERHEAEAKRLLDARIDAQDQLDEVEEEVRAFLRNAGMNEEAEHGRIETALRAYRSRLAQHREQRGRLRLLEERLQLLRNQSAQEEEELKKQKKILSALLARAGVASLEQWRSLAEQAREYREVWEKRTGLMEQLDSLLQGRDINVLRQAVDKEAPLAPAPKLSREALKEESERLAEELEALNRESHALHIEMTEQTAGMRSINEIDEEYTTLERQRDALELEFDATTYAMAQIEDIAHDKHARIAPKLARHASKYLAEITEQRYSELLLSRDLTVSVRIPQTNRMDDAPEKSLSKGTVDQIYLALRLALIQAISEDKEASPMLLDDPFANYDDIRLERTLRLLDKLAHENQILLFTCREDVVRAAESIKAPIIRL